MHSKISIMENSVLLLWKIVHSLETLLLASPLNTTLAKKCYHIPILYPKSTIPYPKLPYKNQKYQPIPKSTILINIFSFYKMLFV